MIILQHHCYIANYCPHASMEKMFMNTENSKTNEPHKPQKSNCCTWKNIRQQSVQKQYTQNNLSNVERSV